MLFPTSCPVCGRTGPAPCGPCAARLRPAPPLPPPPGLDACRAVLAYDGAARDLVARIKYRNAHSVVPWLGERMAACVADLDGAVVTWAPTADRRRRDRGFDQAALLARRVARARGDRAVALLRRAPGRPQTGLDLVGRRQGPEFHLRPGAARSIAGGAVVVVDDVVTSGATMTRAACVLREAGATLVVGVAAARTPRGGGH